MAVTTLPRILLVTLVASTLTVGCRHDRDDDGYHAGEDLGVSDCDDDNADIHPDADEYCNEVDDDCDGVVDEDAVDAPTWYLDADDDSEGVADPETDVASCSDPSDEEAGIYYVSNADDCDDSDPYLNSQTAWYPDADGDGFGDESAEPTLGCISPGETYVRDGTDCDDTRDDVNPDIDELDYCDDVDHDCDGSLATVDDDGDGYKECDGDCDDANADTYPGADEYCNEIDDDCDGSTDESDAVDAPTWYLDVDGDGFGGDFYSLVQCDLPDEGWVDNNDDCDDLVDTTYPEADEYCNSVDDDCDGEIDEDGAVDAPTYYIDADADGYGTDTSVITDQCELPSGYADVSGDCDDADNNTYPGAPEYCDGEDDDCDGTADPTTSVDAATWYRDSDGDGYGLITGVAYGCTQPSGYAAVSGDCADSDATRNPGADELCDGVDNDCDGTADESSAVDAEIWYADTDADGYGNPASSMPACSQPISYVDDATDCDDTTDTVNPGADEVCNDGIDNDCDGGFGACTMDLVDADAVFIGSASSDQGARTITTVSDWNADGVDDLLIGSRSASGTKGVAYLYYGVSTIADWGHVVMGTAATGGADVTFTGAASGDYAAVTSAGTADMNGDGAVDIVLGSASPDSERGAVWMVFGNYTSVPEGDISLADADASWLGQNAYDRAGGPGGLSYLGDIDGDGEDDMAIGANSADRNGTSSGTCYVVYGPVAAGTHQLSGVGDLVYGEAIDDRFAKVVTSTDDFNGDGLPELVVATLYHDVYRGRAYVFETPPSGALNAADADVIFDGEDLSDYAGFSANGAGDQDGDGLGDLLVGATRDDTGAADGGAAYLLLGGTSSGDLGSQAYAKIYGRTSSGNLGSDVAGVEDFDGAGTPAVLVSATSEVAAQGAIYLFNGLTAGSHSTAEADAMFYGTDAADGAGSLLQFSGDLDGSGMPYILIGAYQADLGGTDAGAAYLIEGIGM